MRNLIMMLLTVLMATSAIAESIAVKAEKDEIALIPSDDPFMAKMMQHAQNTLDDFLNTYNSPNKQQNNFALKVGIEDGVQVEYFWVNQFLEKENGSFVGILDNEPRLVSNVKFGQKLSFTRAEIVDWTFVEGNKMKGNFTACAILRHEPEEQRKEFQALYGLDCKI